MLRPSPNPFLAPKKKPLVLGHRGTPLIHQENSCAGFDEAVRHGIDGVEFDVFLTRDERVVVFHDEDTERLTGVPGRIVDMTWDDVSKLRLQKHIHMGRNARGEEIVQHFEREQPIPLLEDVLSSYKGRLLMNVELKPPVPRYSERHVGEHVAEAIRHAGAEDSVIVTSFDFFKLRSVEKTYRELHTGFAWDDNMTGRLDSWLLSLPEMDSELGKQPQNQNPETLLNWLLEKNVIGRWINSTVVGIEHTLIDSDTIERFHARSMAVGAYTLFPLDTAFVKHPLAEPEEIEVVRKLVSCGVDWIETDDPVKLKQLIG